MSVPAISSAWLLEKLRREQYDLTDPKHTVTDLASRAGWNRRANALIAEIRIEIGLQELREIEVIESVDTRLRNEIIRLDLGEREEG
jgi:hypothetical protein